MSLRVLIVSAEYPPSPGGVGDYTALLAAHLGEAGTSVAVLTTGKGDTERVGTHTISRTVTTWDWGVRGRLREAVAAFKPDIVHLQYQTGMYQMHPAVNFLPVPARRHRPHGTRPLFVTTFHDLLHPYLFPKAARLRAYVTRRLARASDRVIATNGLDATTLAQWGVVARVIPIGSNIPVARTVDAQVIRARYGVAPGAVMLTTFGLLNHSKGTDTVLGALVRLRREGIDAHLLMVGAGVGESDATNVRTENALTAQLASADVAASVTRTGALRADDVAQALAAGDLCLLPYRDGASPRRGSLLAALAQGVPVVTTTPAPGVYDRLPPLRDGDAVLFVPPDDAGALAAAVRRVIGDAALAARLRAGASCYAARFGWPTIAAQTLAVYGEVRERAVTDEAAG